MLCIFLVFAHMVGGVWWALGVADFNCKSAFGRPTGTSWVVRAGVVVCQKIARTITQPGVLHNAPQS